MKKVINSGNKRKSLTIIDNITYSVQKDLDGNDIELKMSILLQNGNSEMKLAIGEDDPKEDHSPKPVVLWIPGGGWRGTDKNMMVAEMRELADAGYVVASIYYRSSHQGKFPAQIIDVKTAVRFLRAHADKYEIDPNNIAVMGRSAGGHLAAFAGMNLEGYDTEEWSEYSSDVQACCNMFGPTDIPTLMKSEEKKIKENPNFRWKTLSETHGGALLGGDEATMIERSKKASPTYLVNAKMSPMLILHGDNDPLVPCELSSDILYKNIQDAGLEERVQYYILENGGHGSREFFQPVVKDLIVDFFDNHMER